MNDITCLYLTASKLKPKFAEYVRGVLREAIGDMPLISISRDPLDFGINIIDNGEKSTDNIYRQMLRGAYLAKTDFIAIAEDDCLYHKNHFEFYRPDKDVFAYDQNRFALFTWGEPMYSWRNRRSNCSLIAPRELMIEALEERFKRHPNPIPDKIVGELGRGMVERNMRVTERKSTDQFAEVSIIQFNHDASSESRQVRHRKRLGQIKAYSLYHWGSAEELRKNYEN